MTSLYSQIILNIHNKFGHDFQNIHDLGLVGLFLLFGQGAGGFSQANNLGKIYKVQFLLALEYLD